MPYEPMARPSAGRGRGGYGDQYYDGGGRDLGGYDKRKRVEYDDRGPPRRRARDEAWDDWGDRGFERGPPSR